MKVQLDFENKIMIIEGVINFKELSKKIKSLLPDWKDWSLRNTDTFIYWYNPTTWDWQNPYIYQNEIQLSKTQQTTTNTVCLELN
jgi:hypothetical protein